MKREFPLATVLIHGTLAAQPPKPQTKGGSNA